MGRSPFPRAFRAIALLLAWTALLTFLSSSWTRRQLERLTEASRSSVVESMTRSEEFR